MLYKFPWTYQAALSQVFHCVHFEAPAQVGSENRPRVRGFDHAVAPVLPHPLGGSSEDGRISPAGAEAVVVEDSHPAVLEAGPARERLHSTARSDHEDGRAREEGAVGRVREEGAVGRVREEGSVERVREDGLTVRVKDEGATGRVREDVGVGARRRDERCGGARARQDSDAGRMKEEGSLTKGVREEPGESLTMTPEGAVVPERTPRRHRQQQCLQIDSDDEDDEDSKEPK